MNYSSLIYRYIMVPFSMFLSGIKWEYIYWLFKGRKHSLTLDDMHRVNEKLKEGRKILLSRRNTHLTTYFISLGHFLLTGKMAYYSHTFGNTTTAKRREIWDTQFFEAVGSGCGFSAFDEVINVDGICVLQPIGVSDEEWTEALSRVVRENHNKPYDSLFKLSDPRALSCVEVYLEVIRNLPPSTQENFKPFFEMIAKYDNLTPQMFYDCRECFSVILEIRR